MKAIKNFHSRVRWLRLRSSTLRRDEYMCRHCKRFGKTTEATHVHHIFPIETNWELRYVMDNLISLCNKCHEMMHNRVTDEVTKAGIEWQKRIENKIRRNPPSK